MKSLAAFAIRHRWWVIAAWVAFIVLTQGISGALGGASYKDTFSLPHTETAAVAKVLKKSGLDWNERWAPMNSFCTTNRSS